MEDFFDLDDIRAKAFLQKEGDSKNILLITGEHLMIVRKGRKSLFPLLQIKSLRTTTKKSLFPLFIGGIFTPFALLSYFTNMFHPMVHLIATLLGLLLFYIGWSGRHALILTLTKRDEEFIFLPAMSRNLEAFIAYANGLLSGGILSAMIFFETGQSGLFADEKSDKDDFPRFGFTYQQVLKRMDIHSKVIAIDPLKAGTEVKFEYDRTCGEMRPVVARPLDRNSSVEVSPSDFI